MLEKVYEITYNIDSTEIKRKLDKIKKEIENNEEIKNKIKKFYDKKALYERYNLKDEYIKEKINLMNDEIIKSYLEIQNEFNLLSLKINDYINKITKI